jgi:RNA polymerase sigma-70 factor, ECF subfamily
VSDDEIFLELRPKLFGLAYRMLGTATDAEDVLQEAYLRWRQQARANVRSPQSFLATVVIRLSLDALGSARARRERYVGPWLPEPLLVDDADPADAAELADSLSMAFLVLLEELSPAERAAFLLHDVFDYGYRELAEILAREPPACRQLVARARRHLDARRRRFDADRGRAAQLTEQFAAACTSGDINVLAGMLADDVVVWADGGGQVKAPPRPIIGPAKAARFLAAVAPGLPPEAEVRQALLNGQQGLVVVHAGVAIAAIVLDAIDGRISGVRIVANPDKLGAVNKALAGP